MCVDLPSKKKEKKKNQTKKAENYRSQHITLNLGERKKKKKNPHQRDTNDHHSWTKQAKYIHILTLFIY